MAFALVQEFPILGDDRTTATYDAVQERLGSDLPPGCLIHTAGFDERAGVFRIFTVWEDEADWARFRDERLMPVVAPRMAEGARPPDEHGYRLHRVLRP